MKEVPSQVYGVSSWKEEDTAIARRFPQYKPTMNCHVVFLADVPAHGTSLYMALYGNASLTKPIYKTDLSVSGEKMGRVVDNNMIKVDISPKSGQLNSVTLKGATPQLIDNSVGVLHWNPDCFVPPNRGWQHSFDWTSPALPETYSEIQGPVIFETKRSGTLPGMPEVHLTIIYRFVSQQRYILISTLLEIGKDIGVIALRNDEMVIRKTLFSMCGWKAKSGKVNVSPLVQSPTATYEVAQLAEADAPWVCLFHPGTRLGFGSVRINFTQFRQTDGEIATWHQHTYIYAPPDGPYIYWVRPMIYSWANKEIANQKLLVPAGSYYYEQNAYMPFRIGTGKRHFESLNDLENRMKHPLEVRTF